MKKKLLIISGILLPVVLAVFFFQFYLAGILSEKVNTALGESVDAQVVWDPENISVSFFQDFPNVTASLSEIGIINNAPFADEVLFVTDELRISVDPFSLFSSRIKVSGISLNEPIIHVKINHDGRANYDIVKSSGDAETVASDEISADYNLSVDHWEISNGMLVYEDQTTGTILEMKHINHRGSGDFTPGEMVMDLSLQADSVSLIYDNTSYLTDKKIGVDLSLGIADEFSLYTFKDNTIRVNDFTMQAAGSVRMIDSTAYGLDVTFAVPDNDFSDLLSLVPGMYTQDFSRISASGTFDFQAALNGTLSDEAIPAFTVSLQTEGASFQYADMPVGIRDISLDFHAENSTGAVSDTRIALNTLSMMVGKNSFTSSLVIGNLRDYPVDATVKTSLDLKEIIDIFPVEDMQASGIATLDIAASGTYDSTAQRMPVMKGSASLENVMFAQESTGYEISGLNLNAVLQNATGAFSDLLVDLQNSEFLFDGQKISVNGQVKNLNNPAWKFNATGKLDLQKLSGMFESAMEGIERGMIAMDIHTEGNMEALEQEKYLELPTRGTVQVTNFAYKQAEFENPFVIENASMSFDPRQISLTAVEANFGESDFRAEGTLKDYLRYILTDNHTLSGTLSMNSEILNLDEFMTSEVSADSVAVSGESELIRVPSGIDIGVSTEAKKVIVSGITLNQVSGTARIADEKVILDQLKFNTLGGNVALSGVFQTKTLPPTINMKVTADAMDVAATAQSLAMVDKYLPVSRIITGKYGTDLNLSAALLDDLSLDLTTVSAEAMVECIKAALKTTPITQQVARLSGVNESEVRTIEDLMMHISIKDGKLLVDPFDVKIGKYEASIFGSNGLDGSLAYQMTVQVPAGDMGEKLNQYLASQNTNVSQDQQIPLTFGIGGTMNSPEVAILMDEQKAAITAALKQKAAGEAEEAVEDLLENVKDEKTKELINSLMGKKEDTVKINRQDSTSVDSTKTDAADLKKQALDEVKNLFKRKKKDASDE